MKTFVRPLLLALVAAFTFACVACADRSTPIEVKQLPAAARQLLTAHFKTAKVALATKERDGLGWTYEVTFSNGDQIEFDKKGQWTDLDCKRTRVPSALVPATISRYISANYSGAQVTELSRDKRGYDVRLSNGLELEFDSRGRLTDIDH